MPHKHDFGLTTDATAEDVAEIGRSVFDVTLWPRANSDCEPKKRFRVFLHFPDGTVREIVRPCKGRPMWRCRHGGDRVEHYERVGRAWFESAPDCYVAVFRTGVDHERRRRRKRITQRAKASGADGYRIELDIGLVVVISTMPLDGGELGARTVPTGDAWMVMSADDALELWTRLLTWPSPVSRKPEPFGAAPRLEEATFDTKGLVLFDNSPAPNTEKRKFTWQRMSELGFDVARLMSDGLPLDEHEDAQAAWEQVIEEWAERVSPIDLLDVRTPS